VAGPLRYEAAPLDARARGLLVGWLTAWFVAVAALLGWSLAGGGLPALGAAVVAGTVLPLAVLARLAGLPSAFEVDGTRLRVRRYLLPDRSFSICGPVVRGARPPAPGRGWLGSGYGCRWSDWAADAANRERVFLAVTDAGRAVRIGTVGATVVATPADPDGLARAVRAAARQAGGPAVAG
jgi:hypothetical protein